LKYIIFVLLLVFSGCSTLEVNVDYDEAYNFNEQKTYSINREFKDGENSLFIDRVKKAINMNLEAKNYKQITSSQADFIVTFNAKVENKTSTYTDYQMVGMGRYRYGGAMISTTSSYNYDDGTLVIDVINPKTKKIVWRGVGQAEVQQQDTPSEKQKYLNEIVTKIMEKFPAKK